MTDNLIICRCEEITQRELEQAIEQGLMTMNEVKRSTRAGMGLCQGKTCGRIVMGILAHATRQDLSKVGPCTTRPPTRALPISVLANRWPDDENQGADHAR